MVNREFVANECPFAGITPAPITDDKSSLKILLVNEKPRAILLASFRRQLSVFDSPAELFVQVVTHPILAGPRVHEHHGNNQVTKISPRTHPRGPLVPFETFYDLFSFFNHGLFMFLFLVYTSFIRARGGYTWSAAGAESRHAL